MSTNFLLKKIKIKKKKKQGPDHYSLVCLGVRDQFRLGELRSVVRILIHCLPENQVVLPEYYMIFFSSENGHLKNYRGVSPQPPPPASYAYRLIMAPTCSPATSRNRLDANSNSPNKEVRWIKMPRLYYSALHDTSTMRLLYHQSIIVHYIHRNEMYVRSLQPRVRA